MDLYDLIIEWVNSHPCACVSAAATTACVWAARKAHQAARAAQSAAASGWQACPHLGDEHKEEDE